MLLLQGCGRFQTVSCFQTVVGILAGGITQRGPESYWDLEAFLYLQALVCMMCALGGEWGMCLKIQNAKSKTMKFLILNLEFPTLLG